MRKNWGSSTVGHKPRRSWGSKPSGSAVPAGSSAHISPSLCCLSTAPEAENLPSNRAASAISGTEPFFSRILPFKNMYR